MRPVASGVSEKLNTAISWSVKVSRCVGMEADGWLVVFDIPWQLELALLHFMLKYVHAPRLASADTVVVVSATFVHGITLYTSERVVSRYRYLTGSSFDTRRYQHR